MNGPAAIFLLFTMLTLGAAPVYAEQGQSLHRVAGVSPATDMTEGEIRKIDKQAKKITLRHGEIKNLDMPSMTMVFNVKDPGMLDGIKVGDKVRFKAEKTGGAYIVTAIEPVK